MKNRIKSYWSNCLSIAAIICSVVAICVSLPSAPELGIDYIGGDSRDFIAFSDDVNWMADLECDCNR